MHCQDCGRYSNTRFPGVLPRRRSTEPFRREVFEKHHGGIAQSYLSKQLGIGAATIERWYHDFLGRYLSETKDLVCPRVLGIDEHFFSRKKGYATTFVDLTRHKVFDVVLGRSEKSLEGYLKNLKGRERVRVVLMDLSETYRSIVRKYFPNAKIVSDRFHVVRLVNHAFLKAWALMDPIGRKNRALLSLVRRHESNLSEQQKLTLRQYLKMHPGLESIYDFKQRLVQLMLIKHRNARQCRQLIPELIQAVNQLIECPIEALKTLGRSLHSWLEEIARMWRFTKTNSITEGLHNKMEAISRRAYGFKNFTNYRLRVLVLCGYSSRV
jgi:transposase